MKLDSSSKDATGIAGYGQQGSLKPFLASLRNGKQLTWELWGPTQSDSTIVPVNDVWTHIALTYDGSGTAQFFQNGVASTKTFSSGGDLITPTSGYVVVGAEIDNDEGMAGTIKDFRIYDTVLTAEEMMGPPPACDVTKCRATIYKGCPAKDHCGPGCDYMPGGISQNPSCASHPCSEISATGDWQNTCSGIDGIDISGGCTAQLARGSSGSNPYSKVFQTGFTGLWMVYENGVHFGDNVNSIKFTCPIQAVNGSWSEWSNFTECSTSCGDGVQSRNRTCSNPPPQGNGLNCSGEASDVQSCNLGICVLGLSLNCTEEGMTFSYRSQNDITARVLVVGGEGSSNNASSCTTNLTKADTTYVFLNYSTCEGDAITTTEETEMLVHEATIEVTHGVENNNNQLIFRTSVTKYLYKLKCKYNRDYNVSNYHNVLVPGAQQILPVTIEGTKKISLEMNLYESSSFDMLAPTPKNVTLNEPIYIAVEKANPNPNHKMVVQECWATATISGSSFKYPFMQNGCGLDSTYQTLTETANTFHFKINTFVFLRIWQTMYLHCRVFICKEGSTSPNCQLGCSVGRKRRDVDDISRERRAVDDDLADVDQSGMAVSGRIQYTEKKTCSNTVCSTNATCVEAYPAYCRCIDGHVTNKLTNECTQKRVVEIDNFHTNLTWNEAYKDPHSVEFLNLAKRYEDRMMKFYVEEKRVPGIVGIKITGMREGSVIFRVQFIIKPIVTPEEVVAQIRNITEAEPEAVVRQLRIIVDDDQKLKPVLVVPTLIIPTLKPVHPTGINVGMLAAVVSVSTLAVLVSAGLIFVVSKKRCGNTANGKRKADVNSDPSGEGVSSAHNEAFQMDAQVKVQIK
jgi:hypothetical protein